MYIVKYNKSLNGLYIRINNDIDTEQVKKLAQLVKDIVRKKLTSRFISVLDLEDIEIETVLKYGNELIHTQGVLSIKKIRQVIRIGSKEVLDLLADNFDTNYHYKTGAPTISHYYNVNECLDELPGLDMWFAGQMIKK